MSKREYPGETSVSQAMCGNRVLMEKFEKEEMYGSIWIPETAQRRGLCRNTVVAIGPDVKDVKIGDTVITVDGLGTTIEDHKTNKVYVQIDEPGIIAIDIQ